MRTVTQEEVFGKPAYIAQPGVPTRMPDSLFLWESCSKSDLIKSVVRPEHFEGTVKVVKTHAFKLVGNVLWAYQHREGPLTFNPWNGNENDPVYLPKIRNTLACYLIAHSMPHVPYIEVVEEGQFPVYMNCPSEFLDYNPDAKTAFCNPQWRACVRFIAKLKGKKLELAGRFDCLVSPEYFLGSLFWSLASFMNGWGISGGEIHGSDPVVKKLQSEAAERKALRLRKLKEKDALFLVEFIKEWSTYNKVDPAFTKSLDVEFLSLLATGFNWHGFWDFHHPH